MQKSPKIFTRHIDEMPSPSIVSEIDEKVDMLKLERMLMKEGIQKFAEPQMALIKLIAQKRAVADDFMTSYERSVKDMSDQEADLPSRLPKSSPRSAND